MSKVHVQLAVLVLCAVWVTEAVCGAQGVERRPASMSYAEPPREIPDSFTLEGLASYFHYREAVQLPLKSTERGWLAGAALTYRHETANEPYVQGCLEVLGGTIKYDRSTQTGIPLITTSQALIVRMEGVAGYV